jgi:hypothetical protein
MRAKGLHSIRNELEQHPEDFEKYRAREEAWRVEVEGVMRRGGCSERQISRFRDVTNSEIGQGAAGADYGPEVNWLLGLMEVRLARLWEVIESTAARSS